MESPKNERIGDEVELALLAIASWFPHFLSTFKLAASSTATLSIRSYSRKLLSISYYGYYENHFADKEQL